MGTHNICFRGEIRKQNIFIWLLLLSAAMVTRPTQTYISKHSSSIPTSHSYLVRHRTKMSSKLGQGLHAPLPGRRRVVNDRPCFSLGMRYT